MVLLLAPEVLLLLSPIPTLYRTAYVYSSRNSTHFTYFFHIIFSSRLPPSSITFFITFYHYLHHPNEQISLQKISSQKLVMDFDFLIYCPGLESWSESGKNVIILVCTFLILLNNIPAIFLSKPLLQNNLYFCDFLGTICWINIFIVIFWECSLYYFSNLKSLWAVSCKKLLTNKKQMSCSWIRTGHHHEGMQCSRSWVNPLSYLINCFHYCLLYTFYPREHYQLIYLFL